MQGFHGYTAIFGIFELSRASPIKKSDKNQKDVGAHILRSERF